MQDKTAHPPGSPSATKKRQEGPPANLAELQKDAANLVQHYVLAQVLGKGGMGQVWKAWDTKLQRWVALKFLTLDDEGNVKRFEREARLAARLRHPNIAAIHEIGEHKGRHYLVMEFIDGVSLGKAGLALRPAVEAILKCARAVEEAHKAGVIHRDLKPDNLMITPAGFPYVMDFGLAKAVETEASLSVSGDVLGTPSFMSPEQAKGEIDTLDARTDVYSLGATLYALLTGQKPFSGKTTIEILVKVVNQEVVPPRKIKPEIPGPLEAIVLKAMEKERDRRYPSAEALALDLERWLGNAEVEAKLPGLSSIIVRRIRRNLVPASLGFALLLAFGGGIALWAGRLGSGWIDAFRAQRRPLEYASFKPGDLELPTRLNALLAKPGLSAGDAREATDWFRAQIEIAENDGKAWPLRLKSEWPLLKESASRARAWCDAASGAIQGVTGDLGALAPRFAALRRSAESTLAYRGEFKLRIATMPHVVVKDLKRHGQSLPIKDRQSPLVLENLQIDDYEIELSHPTLPGVTLSLPASKLADGGTYTVVGDLRKEGSVQIR
jgi:predicted Ser/Thr protein kinase